MPGSERGNVAKYRHIDGSAVVIGAVLGYMVQDDSGAWAMSATGPAEGYIAYDTGGYPTVSPDNPTTARLAILGGTTPVILSAPEL